MLASDLAELLRCRRAAGEPLAVEFSADACVTVVLASEGYPASPRTGDVIDGLSSRSNAPGITVFHAGTARCRRRVGDRGGSVLDVTATGVDLATRGRAPASRGGADQLARHAVPARHRRRVAERQRGAISEPGGGSVPRR